MRQAKSGEARDVALSNAGLDNPCSAKARPRYGPRIGYSIGRPIARPIPHRESSRPRDIHSSGHAWAIRLCWRPHPVAPSRGGQNYRRLAMPLPLTAGDRPETQNQSPVPIPARVPRPAACAHSWEIVYSSCRYVVGAGIGTSRCSATTRGASSAGRGDAPASASACSAMNCAPYTAAARGRVRARRSMSMCRSSRALRGL